MKEEVATAMQKLVEFKTEDLNHQHSRRSQIWEPR